MALDAFHLANQGQVKACAEAVLEEEWRSRAVEPSLGNDGDAITKEISLIHVVSGHDDGSACEEEVGVVPRQALVMWSPELGVNEQKQKKTILQQAEWYYNNRYILAYCQALTYSVSVLRLRYESNDLTRVGRTHHSCHCQHPWTSMSSHC